MSAIAPIAKLNIGYRTEQHPKYPTLCGMKQLHLCEIDAVYQQSRLFIGSWDVLACLMRTLTLEINRISIDVQL